MKARRQNSRISRQRDSRIVPKRISRACLAIHFRALIPHEPDRVRRKRPRRVIAPLIADDNNARDLLRAHPTRFLARKTERYLFVGIVALARALQKALSIERDGARKRIEDRLRVLDLTRIYGHTIAGTRDRCRDQVAVALRKEDVFALFPVLDILDILALRALPMLVSMDHLHDVETQR